MKYDNITVTKKENSEVEITGLIPLEAMTKYRAKALKDIGETANIAGFRKGHIPEKILVDKVGEISILEEAAEFALKDIAPEIIEKNVPNYVGRPRIGVTKLAPGNPLEFKISVDVFPEVTFA
jgi:trigger factor